MANDKDFKVKHGLDVNGNITVNGTVDGRDIASDGSKLDNSITGAGLETGGSYIAPSEYTGATEYTTLWNQNINSSTTTLSYSGGYPFSEFILANIGETVKLVSAEDPILEVIFIVNSATSTSANITWVSGSYTSMLYSGTAYVQQQPINYINEATSLYDADIKLDTALAQKPDLTTANTWTAQQTFDTGIKLNDNDSAYFGTENDLQVYHQSSTGNNRIDGSSNILITASTGIVGLQSGSGQAGVYVDGTSTKLYNVGNKKLETTSTGVTVTGAVTATSFDGTVQTDTLNPLTGETINVYADLVAEGKTISAGSFIGDGSALTNLPSSTNYDGAGLKTDGSYVASGNFRQIFYEDFSIDAYQEGQIWTTNNGSTITGGVATINYTYQSINWDNGNSYVTLPAGTYNIWFEDSSGEAFFAVINSDYTEVARISSSQAGYTAGSFTLAADGDYYFSIGIDNNVTTTIDNIAMTYNGSYYLTDSVSLKEADIRLDSMINRLTSATGISWTGYYGAPQTFNAERFNEDYVNLDFSGNGAIMQVMTSSQANLVVNQTYTFIITNGELGGTYTGTVTAVEPGYFNVIFSAAVNNYESLSEINNLKVTEAVSLIHINSSTSLIDAVSRLDAAILEKADLSGANTWSAEQTFNAGIQLNDDDVAFFGTDSDMRIKHNGSHGYIENFTGSLYMSSNQLYIHDGNYINSVSILDDTGTGMGVKLHHGGNTKLATTSTGISVTGLLTATQKSFTIPHPTKEGMKLRYGSLEGPENGVYVRGQLKGTNIIELPEYWTKLVHEDSITVQLTANKSFQKLFVKDIINNTIIIGNDSWFSNNTDCFYVVYGERKDVEKLTVEF